MQYAIPDKIYQALKWAGLVCLPACAVFYGTCAPLWGWPAPEAVVTTINAAGVLMGACLGYSAVTAKAADGEADGEGGLTMDDETIEELNDGKGED